MKLNQKPTKIDFSLGLGNDRLATRTRCPFRGSFRCCRSVNAAAAADPALSLGTGGADAGPAGQTARNAAFFVTV